MTIEERYDPSVSDTEKDNGRSSPQLKNNIFILQRDHQTIA
jgi:hypothetical protein